MFSFVNDLCSRFEKFVSRNIWSLLLASCFAALAVVAIHENLRAEEAQFKAMVAEMKQKTEAKLWAADLEAANKNIESLKDDCQSAYHRGFEAAVFVLPPKSKPIPIVRLPIDFK